MSASEKLKALEKLDPTSRGAVLGALNPQIVAVVEAAEAGRDHSLLLSSEPAGVEMVGWSVKRARALHRALAALDEALS